MRRVQWLERDCTLCTSPVPTSTTNEAEDNSLTSTPENLTELQKQLQLQQSIIDKQNSEIRDLKRAKNENASSKKKSTEANRIQSDTFQNKIFSNAVIMENILNNLDVASVKNARRVSTTWAKHGTTVISKKSSLNLNKFFEIPAEVHTKAAQLASSATRVSIKGDTFVLKAIGLGIVPQVNSQLVKNTHIGFESQMRERVLGLSELNEGNNYSWPQKLILFCEEYGSKISKLEIGNSSGNGLIRPMHRILQTLCPSLEILKLVNFGNRKENPDSAVDHSLFLQKPIEKLKVFVIEGNNYELAEHLQKFIKKIISASPSLQQLSYNGNYYPDLSLNTNLKQLSVSGCNNRIPLQVDKFNFKAFEGMLKEIENGPLEILNLTSNRNLSPFTLKDYTWTLPKLDKLKEFRVFGLSQFRLQSLHFLDKLPKLKTLELIGSSNMDGIFESSQLWITTFSSKTMETLKLGQFEDLDVLKSVAQMFPNLKTISFTFGRDQDELTRFQIDAKMESLFALLNSLKHLQDLDMKILFYYELSALAKLLFINANFIKGLKTLLIKNGKLTNRNYLGGSQNELEAALMLTQSMQNCEFVNFHMEMSIAIAIAKFISEKKLPVEFKNRF